MQILLSSGIYLQIKGRNETHDSNIQPGLQLKSHTQYVEHEVAEILSSYQNTAVTLLHYVHQNIIRLYGDSQI